MSFVTFFFFDLFFFLASGVLWLPKGKSNGAWQQTDWTVIGYCSHSVAYVSPQTALKALQEQILLLHHSPSDISGCLQDCRMHRLTQLPPWSTKAALRDLETPEAEAFGCICFDFFKKFFIYILCACVGMCGDTAEEEVSYNTYLKMSNLQIQYGTSEVGWALLSTCPARPCSTWKANSKVELSQALL